MPSTPVLRALHTDTPTESAGREAEPVLAGEHEEDARLIDDAVRDLNALVRAKEVETAYAIAQYVLDHFFGGSLDVYLSRGAGHVSLRRLIQDPRLHISRSRLGESLQVVAQLRSLPDELSCALSYTHQRTLLPVVDVTTKIELARQVRERGLSSRELQAQVLALRPSPSTQRPPRRRSTDLVEAGVATPAGIVPTVDSSIEAILTEIGALVEGAERVHGLLRAARARGVSIRPAARLCARLEDAIEKLDAIVDDFRAAESATD